MEAEDRHYVEDNERRYIAGLCSWDTYVDRKTIFDERYSRTLNLSQCYEGIEKAFEIEIGKVEKKLARARRQEEWRRWRSKSGNAALGRWALYCRV